MRNIKIKIQTLINWENADGGNLVYIDIKKNPARFHVSSEPLYSDSIESFQNLTLCWSLKRSTPSDKKNNKVNFNVLLIGFMWNISSPYLGTNSKIWNFNWNF